MEDRIERVLALARHVDKLRGQERHVREERERAEAELLALINAHHAATSASPPALRLSAGSLASRVIKVVEADPAREFTVAEIATVVGVEPPNRLSSTLNRLKDEKRLRHTGRGTYRAYVHEVTENRRTVA